MIEYFRSIFKVYSRGVYPISLFNTIVLRIKSYSFKVSVFLPLVLFIIFIYMVIILLLIDSVILCDGLTMEELKHILVSHIVKYNEASTEYQYYVDL
jgi:hypothetical protein